MKASIWTIILPRLEVSFLEEWIIHHLELGFDEIYIYDRYHKNGDDMIKRSTMMLHEFSYTITIKKEYEHCWWNGEVAGCKLFDEYAFDPKNKAWDLE